MINSNQEKLSITKQCQLLHVARSSCYYNSLFKGARDEKAIGLSNRLDEVEFLMSEPKRIAESLEEK